MACVYGSLGAGGGDGSCPKRLVMDDVGLPLDLVETCCFKI